MEIISRSASSDNATPRREAVANRRNTPSGANTNRECERISCGGIVETKKISVRDVRCGMPFYIDHQNLSDLVAEHGI